MTGPTQQVQNNSASPDAKLAHKGTKMTVIAGIFVALITAGVNHIPNLFGGSGPQPNPDSTQFLAVEDLNSHATNSLSGPNVHVYGRLLSTPPLGMQVWAMSRFTWDGRDVGELNYGKVAFPDHRCKVNTQGRNFDCGQVNLGKPTQSGTFYVWVALANATTIAKIVDDVAEQAASADFSHDAPEGLNPVGPFTIHRP